MAFAAAKPEILAPVAYSAYTSPVAYSSPIVAAPGVSAYSYPYAYSAYSAYSPYASYYGAYYWKCLGQSVENVI